MPDPTFAKPAEAGNPRLAALTLLRGVLLQHQALDAAPALALDDPRDSALARALAFGVLRWHPLLQARLANYLRKPLKARDADLELLLLTGLYQLGWMRIPAHAAVHATVGICASLGKGWAKGLVNGVLRAYQRDDCPVDAPPGAAPHLQHAHPQWLYQALSEAWPDELEALLAANNAPAPMWLRARHEPHEIRHQLAEAGLAAHPSSHAAQALRLEEATAVEALPGFDQGRVSVQDAAAQLAAPLLDARPGQRVLDACAAPGGKTGHLLERTPDLDLIALEIDPTRARRISENLRRLALDAHVVTGDACRSQDWWDGTPFDRILVDAPCSGSGVIRRHPDIKWLRRQGDIPNLAATQLSLLKGLWPLLADGGRMLYATCSVLPAENDAVIEAFLAAEPATRCVPIEAAWGRATSHGRQILPGEHHMDGFYYALLAKS